MKIETHCPVCKKSATVEVPDKGYAELAGRIATTARDA